MSCGSAKGTAPCGDPRKCLRTRKWIAADCFDLNPKTGLPMSSCVICVPKNRAQHTAYGKTANGKAKRKIQNDNPEVQQAKADWRNSDTGKVKIKEYTDTDAYREKCSKFSKTESGKAIRKRTYSKHKLATDLMNGFARMMRGGNSPSTIKATSFVSAADARKHMRLQLDDGCTMADFGSAWTVDHRIPKSAYDHGDPEDVRRCWSKPNMRPLTGKANKEKYTALLPAEVAKVPPELWPKAWGGVARTA